MKLLGITIMALGALLFYWVFFSVAPYVASMWPDGEYQGIFRVLTYIFLGWVGGVGFPLTLLFMGFGLFVKSL